MSQLINKIELNFTFNQSLYQQLLPELGSFSGTACPSGSGSMENGIK